MAMSGEAKLDFWNSIIIQRKLL